MSNARGGDFRRGTWIAAAALTVLSNEAAFAAGTTSAVDSYQLQSDFASASDLVVEPDWHDLPPDAARVVEHLGKSFFGAKPGLANVGEAWSEGDFVRPNIPAAQHLFSAYSSKVTVSVVLVGGHQATTYALLATRNAENYCAFKIPLPAVTNLQVTIIQDLLNPNRNIAGGPIPKCQPQSLRYAPQLANPVK